MRPTLLTASPPESTELLIVGDEKILPGLSKVLSDFGRWLWIHPGEGPSGANKM